MRVGEKLGGRCLRERPRWLCDGGTGAISLGAETSVARIRVKMEIVPRRGWRPESRIPRIAHYDHVCRRMARLSMCSCYYPTYIAISVLCFGVTCHTSPAQHDAFRLVSPRFKRRPTRTTPFALSLGAVLPSQMTSNSKVWSTRKALKKTIQGSTQYML